MASRAERDDPPKVVRRLSFRTAAARLRSDSQPSAFAAAALGRLVRPERLREGLDGRAVSVSGQSWHLKVYSVLDFAGRRWVQLALEGEPHYMLLLNLTMGAGVQLALRTLLSCLANPSNPTGTLNIT